MCMFNAGLIFCVGLLLLLSGVSPSTFTLYMFSLELACFLYIYMTSWYHTMMLLMLLEMCMLKLYFFLVLSSCAGVTMMPVFVFMSLSVAEASLGMALLTLLIRSHGDDYMLL